MDEHVQEEGINRYDELLYDVLLKNQCAATNLKNLFSDDMQAASKYIKVGRQFWKYDEVTDEFDLITITYVRSGIAFYVKEGETEENSFGTRSVVAALLYPRVIYLQDVAEQIKVYYPDFNPEYLVTMYKRMELDIPRYYIKIDIDFKIILA